MLTAPHATPPPVYLPSLYPLTSLPLLLLLSTYTLSAYSLHLLLPPLVFLPLCSSATLPLDTHSQSLRLVPHINSLDASSVQRFVCKGVRSEREFSLSEVSDLTIRNNKFALHTISLVSPSKPRAEKRNIPAISECSIWNLAVQFMAPQSDVSSVKFYLNWLENVQICPETGEINEPDCVPHFDTRFLNTTDSLGIVCTRSIPLAFGREHVQ